MTATVAQPTGNQAAVWIILGICAVAGILVVLWMHERRMDRIEDAVYEDAEQLAGLDYRLESLLEFLGVEIPEPVEDDSPGALADDCPTDEIPVAPPTVPDGMPLAVQTALIEARDLSDERPHPVDSAERRAKHAADVEEALKQFNFAGRNR